jgi:ribosomal protein S18 acetylase RimI-like enzyme
LARPGDLRSAGIIWWWHGPLSQHIVVDEVRRIRPDEWPQYRDLRLEALKDSPLAFVERYRDASTQADPYWQDRVARGAAGSASSIFVALRAGRFIGKAGWFVESEVTEYVSAHVVGVYVTPRARGQGVADTLMAEVLRSAREEASAARVRLFVMAINVRASAFYRRIGFVPTGATMAYPPNPAFIEHEMEYRNNT